LEDKFVLFLDVLGFSELVLNNPHELVEKICDSELRQTAAACATISALTTGSLHRSFEVQTSPHGALFDVKQENITFHLLSDSVVAWTNDCSIDSLVVLTNFAAQYLAQTIMLGLPHRGAISKGSIKIFDLPLNGRPQSNAVGSGLVRAHRFEGGQEWMGCVIDPECIAGLPTTFVSSWLNDAQSRLTTYEVPYKPGVSIRSNFVVDWRVPFRMFGLAADAAYFQEQFGRHNKPLSESVATKIENTNNFFAAPPA
jgi:hypothetical protein